MLTGLLLLVTYQWMQPRLGFGSMTSWASVDWASYPEVRMLQEYVRIDTRKDKPGGTLAGAEWFADELREMGIEPEFEMVGGEANVWGIVEGELRQAVVLHHHIDVEAVPKPEDWAFEPFAAEITGPWLTGRGAFDMKSYAVAQLFAVRRLLDEVGPGGKPARSVILLATSGEESGSDEGMRWLLRHRPDLTERFAVVLTEGGAVEGRSGDDLKFWGTEFVQRRIVDVSLCGPRAALETLSSDLSTLGLRRSPPTLVPEVERFLEAYGPSRDAADLRQTLSEPRRLIGDPAAFAGLSSYQASFFQNQSYISPPWGSEGDGLLRIRIALLPGEDRERVLEELLPAWSRHGLSVQVVDAEGADHGSPLDHWAFRGIDEVMRKVRPKVTHGPHVLTLTLTDARFLRAAGIPAFGFTPFGVLTTDVMRIRSSGSINERMGLQGFVDGIQVYGEVLARLAS